MADAVGHSGVLWSRPRAAQAGRNLLVMLHGATSSERDPFDRLVPLLREDLSVVAPRGPVAEGDGYSWVSPETRASATTDTDVAAVGNEIARSVLGWLDTLPAPSCAVPLRLCDQPVWLRAAAFVDEQIGH